jgi:hypothetical protein
MPGIGRDLLDVPFAEMVRNMALAIADGQTALDRNSLETLRALQDEEVDLLHEITEIIEPVTRRVSAGGETIDVTGVTITSSGLNSGPVSMLQAGLLPTFYQFTEASIDIKLSITMREDADAQSTRRTTSGGRPWLGLGGSKAWASSVDYRSANKYSYEAAGASSLHATLRPVPPPGRLEPAITTINLLGDEPVVTRTPG